MNVDDLQDMVIAVKLNGKDVFYDPGNPLAPPGLLSWRISGVTGLRLNADGSNAWVTTPLPDSHDSSVERNAHFDLTAENALFGHLTVTYTGLPAFYRRLEEREDDDVARKAYLEDEMKGALGSNAKVELTNKPDWTSPSPTLVAEFTVSVPDWPTVAGGRMLLPAAVFTASERHLFDSEKRVHPVYFAYPYEVRDVVSIGIPQGAHVESYPEPNSTDSSFGHYENAVGTDAGGLLLKRILALKVVSIAQVNYPVLRRFVQGVRSADDGQIVVLLPAD